jgi:hypothetical protein
VRVDPLMSHQAGASAQRGRSLFFALAWVSAWWTFTLSLGWVIISGSSASPQLEPIATLVSRLF